MLAAAVGRLGKPVRVEVATLLRDRGWPELDGMTPLFDLLMTFPAGSSGITDNYWHGAHSTMPAYSDEFGVIFLETSMHKGAIRYDVVYWRDDRAEGVAEVMDQLS